MYHLLVLIFIFCRYEFFPDPGISNSKHCCRTYGWLSEQFFGILGWCLIYTGFPPWALSNVGGFAAFQNDTPEDGDCSVWRNAGKPAFEAAYSRKPKLYISSIVKKINMQHRSKNCIFPLFAKYKTTLEGFRTESCKPHCILYFSLWKPTSVVYNELVCGKMCDVRLIVIWYKGYDRQTRSKISVTVFIVSLKKAYEISSKDFERFRNKNWNRTDLVHFISFYKIIAGRMFTGFLWVSLVSLNSTLICGTPDI
jgi:hypothetical protein